ncbi:unnamed protein product [Bursaphelenchus xylophilus]|uniref:(pine wood nematode) hypothetical protein n=1 Tax=Bursaphelenchus xylophilus TaxID=6326 RepID=A0A1I7RKK7_BURXY|nr:unnamed protein product [Bursaphelenchus xylophilus]CAG9131254.1 unnamed protein product [Bursaphelenchus xylophilus]
MYRFFQHVKINADALPDFTKDCTKGDGLEVNITPNERVPVFKFSDLEPSLVGEAGDVVDHSSRQFLEMLTSQFLIDSGTYELVNPGTIYNTSRTPLTLAMETRDGLHKAVRVNEYQGQVRPLLIADMRRTIFYQSTQTLAEIRSKYIARDKKNGPSQFANMFRGVRCRAIHRPGAHFRIKGITREPISDKKYNAKGDIQQYYKRCGHDINSSLPGVQADIPGKTMAYPLEVCIPLPGQLIPSEKIHKDAEILLENSDVPDKRYDFVMKLVEVISTGPGAEFLSQFGVRIHPTGNDVDIYERNLFNFKFAGAEPVKPEADGNFLVKVLKQKFLSPSKMLVSWWCLFSSRDTTESNVKQYITKLVETAKKAGLALNQPSRFIPVDTGNSDALHQKFKEAVVGKVRFIFFIDGQMSEIHQHLKLFEAHYRILTQHIRVKSMDLTEPQTMNNILMKINTKAFGTNYWPIVPEFIKDYDLIDNKDLLVLGYDVAHPTGKDRNPRGINGQSVSDPMNVKPSVVGICANMFKDTKVFGGEFFYQDPLKEEVDSELLQEATTAFLERCKKQEREIKRILIIRDGLSEGQFAMALDSELRAIKRGLVKAGVDSKVTFVVCSKRHNKRFFVTKNGKIENPPVGAVIRDKVTRTDVKEFFLLSHNPVRGCPKPTQYTVLLNELEIPDLHVEWIIHYLCNMHQICAAPTAIPLPVFMADELAKRGNALYKAYHQLEKSHEIRREMRINHNDPQYYSALSNQFTYLKDALGLTRFNA